MKPIPTLIIATSLLIYTMEVHAYDMYENDAINGKSTMDVIKTLGTNYAETAEQLIAAKNLYKLNNLIESSNKAISNLEEASNTLNARASVKINDLKRITEMLNSQKIVKSKDLSKAIDVMTRDSNILLGESKQLSESAKQIRSTAVTTAVNIDVNPKLPKNLENAGKYLDWAGKTAGVAMAGYNLYKDRQNYGDNVGTYGIGLLDAAETFIPNPLAIGGIATMFIKEKPVGEWGWEDQVMQRTKIFFEAEPSDFYKKLRDTLYTNIYTDETIVDLYRNTEMAINNQIVHGIFSNKEKYSELLLSKDVDSMLKNATKIQDDRINSLNILIENLEKNRELVVDRYREVEDEWNVYFGKTKEKELRMNNLQYAMNGINVQIEKLVQQREAMRRGEGIQQLAVSWLVKKDMDFTFEKAKIDSQVSTQFQSLKDVSSEFSAIKVGTIEVKKEKNKAVTTIKSATFSSDEVQKKSNATEMNSNTANITGSNFSAVGSPARYFQGTSAADRLAYNNLKVAELKKQTVQEGSTYVNGQIIKAPVDVVLRWGATPSDLDSHLTGPTGNPNNANERFHTYYGVRGNLDSSPNALLYHDETNSYGPEQTRINVVNPGVYRFYVHDFSDRNAVGSTALSNSGATVTIHQSGNMSLPEGQNLGAQVAQVNVPTGRTGNTWQAFELDSRTGVLNRTTEFRDVSSPAKVPFNQ